MTRMQPKCAGRWPTCDVGLALCEAVHGPALEVGERVVLIGEPRDGATVAIMRQDGATWLGELRETMKKTRN